VTLLDEVIDACDVSPEVARDAVLRALRHSGFSGTEPSGADLRASLPELRRALEESLPPARAYEAVERVDILLAVKPPDLPREPPTLAELTRRLREANQRLSGRDFEGEIAEAEAASEARRRSMLPPSR
jgi:hypothetical protein